METAKTEDRHPELTAYLAELTTGGLEYSAEFVPQSKSRNAGEKKRGLNWRVTLTRKGAKPLTTDYMQGIGHMPGYHSFNSLHQDRYRAIAAETGRYHVSMPFKSFSLVTKLLPAPVLADVLYSLVVDSDAIEMDFDEWASNYGMDTDSRKAEAMFNQCRDISIQLRRILGNAALEKLRELFQDY